MLIRPYFYVSGGSQNTFEISITGDINSFSIKSWGIIQPVFQQGGHFL